MDITHDRLIVTSREGMLDGGFHPKIDINKIIIALKKAMWLDLWNYFH